MVKEGRTKIHGSYSSSREVVDTRGSVSEPKIIPFQRTRVTGVDISPLPLSGRESRTWTPRLLPYVCVVGRVTPRLFVSGLRDQESFQGGDGRTGTSPVRL